MKKAFLIKSLVGIFVMLFLAIAVSAVAPTDPTDITGFPTHLYVGNTLTVTASGGTDAHNDTITYHYKFYNVNESTIRQDWSATNSYTIQVSDAHDTIRVYAKSTTTGENSPGDYFKDDFVENKAPTISSGSITIDSHESSDTATVSASDADGDSLAYSVAQGDTSLVTCSIPTSGTTLTATRVNDTKTGTTTCTVTVNDGYGGTALNTFTINVNRKSMLEIYDLDVYVDDSKDSNLNDGDTIGKEAKPKSNIKFDFVIKNLFDEDEEDIEIENIFITVTIKEIDDGDDLEEETKEFDLDAEEKSSIKSLEFDLPTAIDEGSYDVEIVVEGEEAKSPYTEHRIEWTLKLEVEKEKHDMKLERAEFDQSTLSCDRETTFSVNLVNFGSSDEDELILTIENSALGINIKQEDIEIDEGDDWSKSYTITVADNIAPGIYKVITKMYYDSSDYYDKDFELNAYGSTDLVISKCVVTTPVEEEVPEEEEGGVIIVEPTTEEEEKETTPTTGEITREVSFQDTSLYLVLLVTAVVILAGIFLVMISRLFPKR